MRRGVFCIASIVSLLLCLAMIVLWVRSYSRADFIDRATVSNYAFVTTSDGVIICGAVESPQKVIGWRLSTTPDGRWEPVHPVAWFSSAVYDAKPGEWWVSSAPIWPFAGVFAVAPSIFGFLLVTRRKRYHAGTCSACGYSLTGNTSGTCPECGTCVPEPSRPA